MAKKAAASGSGEMDAAYVVCRWWPYFASYFPFAQFDDLGDEDLKAALSAFTRKLAAEHADAIKTFRDKRAAGFAARMSGQMGPATNPRQIAPRSAPSEAKPLSMFQICEALGMVVANSNIIQERHWGPGFGPTTSAVIFRTTFSHARDITDAVYKRCKAVEGQYRFRIVPQASLAKPEFIRFQREYQLLEDARLPLPRPEKLLAKRAEPFGQTPTGVPYWTIPLRDEAIAIDGILDVQVQPDTAPEPTPAIRPLTRRRPPGAKAPRGFIFVQDAETEFDIADSTINDWAADAKNNLRPNKDKIAGLKYVHLATLKALIKKRRPDKG